MKIKLYSVYNCNNILFKVTLFVLFIIGLAEFTSAQTPDINGATDGGFELGSTLEASNWVVVDNTSPLRKWYECSGTITNGNYSFIPTGNHAAFIGNGNNSNWEYNSQTSGTTTHLYKDFACLMYYSYKLTFRWNANGDNNNNDVLYVYLCDQSLTPVSGSPAGYSNVPVWNGNGNYQLLGTYNHCQNLNGQNETINIPFNQITNTSMRLVFTWKCDNAQFSDPPAAIDDVNLVRDIAPAIPAVAVGVGTYVGPAPVYNANIIAVPSSPNVCSLNLAIEANTTSAPKCCYLITDSISLTLRVLTNTSCSTLVKWLIDYGDGATAILPYSNNLVVRHLYQVGGNYISKIFLLDANNVMLQSSGINATSSVTLEIHDPNSYSYNCDYCPKVNISYVNKECPYHQTTCLLSLDTLFACSSGNFTYTWNFDDPASGANNIVISTNAGSVAHIFSAAGVYNVTITWSGIITYAQMHALATPWTCNGIKTIAVDASRGLSRFISKPRINADPNPAYIGVPVDISFSGVAPYYTSNTLNFGDGTPVLTNVNLLYPIRHIFQNGPANYIVKLFLSDFCGVDSAVAIMNVTVPTDSIPCKDCIGSFNPEPGKKYMLNAWVREDGAGPLITNFTKPSVVLLFTDVGNVITTYPSMLAKGDIIDGWQRIEEEFTVPLNAVKIDIKLACNAGSCLFDDLRIFPFNGTMKSYVYDPVSLKLSAELDERNYASIYEYNEEGKLIRIKKETERGVMTIREIQNNSSKK